MEISSEAICGPLTSVSSIDLNKLVFNTSSCRYAYNYLLQKGVNSIPGYLSYVDDSWNVNIPLCDIQYINKGSFGVVLSYAEHDVLPDGWAEVKDPSKNGLTYYHNIKTNEKTWIRPPGRKLKPQIKVALKTFKNQNDPELKVINDLNRLGINCNTVNSKVLSRKNSKGGTTTVAVMDIMNGSLGNLKGKIDLNTVLNIIQKLAIDLECLNSKKLAYTDLKTGNILFKCIDGNILKIVLGDLGSICPQGRSNSITYPPPEFRFPNKTSVICNESTMVWGLGIIFLELLNIDVYRPFYHGTISKYTAQQFNKTLRDTVVLASDRYSMKNIEFSLEDVEDFSLDKIQLDLLLMLMLEVDPNKRIGLKSIINILSKKISSNIKSNPIGLGRVALDKKKSHPPQQKVQKKARGSI